MQKYRITKLLLLLLVFTLIITGCKKEVQQPPVIPTLVYMETITQQDTPFKAEYVGITEGSKSVEVHTVHVSKAL